MDKSFFENAYVKKYFNIRYLGLFAFIIASIFCIYMIFTLENEVKYVHTYKKQLKLVSVFMRHGDRSPSEPIPPGDPHIDIQSLIWPNGQTNLTDLGKFRQFKIGLELRHLYKDHIDFNSSHYLAYSSPIYRCQESLQETLHGLFNNEWSLRDGRKLAADYMEKCSSKVDSKVNCNLSSSIPPGFAWPNEWKNIKIDIETIPMLGSAYLDSCKYRLQNPTQVDKDLRASRAISKLGLPALAELEQTLKSKYQIGLNFTSLGLWSTITNEIRLMRGQEMIKYGKHYYDWINRKMPQHFGKDSDITLYDLLEQTTFLAQRDRIVDKANLIQLGPIITNLVQSQLVALSANNSDQTAIRNSLESNERLKNRKMIFYSSHDSILQLFMHRLMIINTEEDKHNYKERFNKYKNRSELERLLAGLRMTNYGSSLVFELYEVEKFSQVKGQKNNVTSVGNFSFIQASLYDREDGRYHPVDYQRIQFGTACQRLFKQLYPKARWDRFYDQKYNIDVSLSCPFELFRNITSGYIIDRPTLDNLCKN